LIPGVSPFIGPFEQVAAQRTATGVVVAVRS
jgi:hypothetical protein